MPVVSFGSYRPDVSDYNGQTSATIVNAYPRGDGYGPAPSLFAYTAALPGPCRGFFYARKSDASVQAFAATADHLYTLDNTTLSWTSCSPDYPQLSSNAQWQFRQFNNLVIAVQVNVPPQVYDLTSSSMFADLGGSPPQAAYISIVNRFIVLSGLAPPNVYRIQWSGLNATTTWDSGVNQSDFQDLADGGIVRGVAGGEFGVIFQDTSIRSLTYAPGSPYVFGIDRISNEDGLYAPYSLINAQDRVFFYSPQGFKMYVPGGYPQPIGKERVDRTFATDIDSSNLQLMIGASDPRATRVYWAYKSVNGLRGFFDKILCYDWTLQQWSISNVKGEYLTGLARPGLTLEGVDDAYGPDLDNLQLDSLDNISTAAFAAFSGVDEFHRVGFFSGPNLEAVLETPEQGGDGTRMRVNGFRPVSDAPVIYGSTTRRENAQALPSRSPETLINAIGICPQRVSTRYARARIRIPAGTQWTFAAGVEPDVATEGAR